MSLKLFNTLSRKKEIFRPYRKNTVTFYACGPTVYDYVHIGNLRTYIFEDILRRTLEFSGYHVEHVVNITDIDDKTISGSKKNHMTLSSFTKTYEKAFKNDIATLNIKSPTKFVRATAHVKDMIEAIEALLKKGAAYTKNGSTYFDISRFPRYGKLTRIKKSSLKVGARVDADEYEKKEAQDFVLWKQKKNGEPAWNAPFGDGRPGWHIECSVMATKYLGDHIDIHAGGVDLLFPHHENEIAQTETIKKKPFVRYWLHGEHLFVDGQKMSKSLKNIILVQDITKKNINPMALRYLMLGAHYRSPLNFTKTSLTASAQTLERLYAFVRQLQEHKTNIKGKTSAKILAQYNTEFDEAIFDDLNTPKAIGVFWKLIREYNKAPHAFISKDVLKKLYVWDSILGLNLRKQKPKKTSRPLEKLLVARENARAAHNFVLSDKIRAQIRSLGWDIEDTPAGPRLKKIQ